MEINKELINRDDDIIKFLEVLDNKNKLNNEIESFNVALNGRWGDGKTTFLNNLIEYLKSNANKSSIKFENIFTINAWDYDFLDDPSEMFFHFLEKENNIQNKVLSLVRDTLKDCAKEYIVDKIPIFKNYINSKESIEKKSSEKQKQLFNILELKQKMIQNAENIKDNIFIFIDDLDRCNPNFVIKLIELTKHIFNIKNITIVYMLDWENINTSIMNHYGLETKNNDNEQYLSKIIDYKWDLPKLSQEEYLFQKYIFPFENKDSFGRDFRNYFNSPELLDWYMEIFPSFPFRKAEKLTIKYAKVQTQLLNLLKKRCYNGRCFIEQFNEYSKVAIIMDKMVLCCVIELESDNKLISKVSKYFYGMNNNLMVAFDELLNLFLLDIKNKHISNEVYDFNLVSTLLLKVVKVSTN